MIRENIDDGGEAMEEDKAYGASVEAKNPISILEASIRLVKIWLGSVTEGSPRTGLEKSQKRETPRISMQ